MRCLLLSVLALLVGCSSSREVRSLGLDALDGASFRLAPRSLERDYALDGEGGGSALKVTERLLKDRLVTLGFKPCASNCDLEVIYGFFEPEYELSTDEARFRRGVRGSHFPDADPRGRTYGEVPFGITIRHFTDNRIVFDSKDELAITQVVKSRQLFERAISGLLP